MLFKSKKIKHPLFSAYGILEYYDLLEAVEKDENLELFSYFNGKFYYSSEDKIDELVEWFLETNKIKPSIVYKLEENECLLEDNFGCFFKKNRDWFYINKVFIETEFVNTEYKIELKFRSLGLFDFSYEELKNEFKRIFGNDYVDYLIGLYEFVLNFKDRFYSKQLENLCLVKNMFYGATISRTGRIFMPLQNKTKEELSEYNCEKDFYFLEIDFKYFEFMILSNLLKLDVLEDPHIKILKHLGLDTSERDFGKRINYAFLYGMSERNILNLIKEETGKEIDVEKLLSFEMFLKSKELISSIKVEDGLFKNYFGRTIKLEKEHALLNNYIQSTAADILFLKLLESRDILSKKDGIIYQNHDSVIFKLSNSFINSEQFKKLIDLFKKSIDNFLFEIDIDYSKNLGFKN